MKAICMKKHRTSNIEQPTSKETGVRAHWMFDVGYSMRDVIWLHRCSVIALVLFSSCLCAFAQTNQNAISVSADYSTFSKFITDRNIFDPNRQPHSSSSRTRTTRSTRTRSASAPSFSLVGTMVYEKGFFAFFSGNSDELKQILPASGKIAGYTVTDVSRGHAVLESADKKQKLELKIGDVMREESGKWELTGQGEVPASSAPATSSSSTTGENSGGGDTPVPAAPANDVLKRLMEKRAKENQ